MRQVSSLYSGTYAGIDAALGGTGVVIIRVTRPPEVEVVHRTTLKPSVRDAEGVAFGRVPLIRGAVGNILRENQPIVVAQEDYIKNRQLAVAYFLQIGELGGALKFLYHERRQAYVLVNNAKLRVMADVDRGEDTKKATLAFVRDYYGVNLLPKEHDQADAFVLALAAFITHRLATEDWRGVLDWFSPRKIELFATKKKREKKHTGVLQSSDSFVGFDVLPPFDEDKLHRLLKQQEAYAYAADKTPGKHQRQRIVDPGSRRPGR